MEYAQLRNGDATMSMEDALLVDLLLFMCLRLSHAKSMDVCLTLLVDVRCAIKDILYFIILVSCQTVSSQTMENALNVILIISSSQMALVSQKMSFVRKWTSLVPV